ncbi:MAG TPA: ATP-binding protein, partial [Saprospiraceae bacterium]|nr:ATP-binding protein [Saprospiraceae bacterium]
IGLHFICSEDEVVMDHDPEKFTAIISNLLSNAIKFSPENENVYISLGIHKEGEKEHLEISVKDNGIGIPREQLDLIFERFYQVDNEMSASGIGTGVGLSLVRELVHLLNGKIEVTSSLGKGTKFTVTLPIHHSAPMSDELFNAHIQLTPSGDDHKPALWSAEKLAGEKGNGKPEILVIEDNQDVIRYIQICLQDQYHVIMSKNGAEGVDMAIRNVPDLILSDVLMPVKDGLTACKELKHNPATSHIPIILLSAKTDPASRIAGLESGADVYMIKPFEKEELRLQIQKLLARFEEFHARYAGDSPVPLAAPEPAHEMEDEFITRIRTLIQEHLDDSEFSVNDIERGVFLSRSQLHKKLKALTGLSAMQYVSRIRLSAAREKLKSGDRSISDIAYEVGFSDPNYFSRAYSDEFGESPSETRKKLKNNHL